jgi:hypothetical protein
MNMMHKKWMLVILIALVAASLPLQTVEAARGIPGSGEFAYGAQLNLDGPFVEPALQMAGNLPLDWISIEFNWANNIPFPTSTMDWSKLDQVMVYAARSNMAVMISITNAPQWALTTMGPDAQHTAALVTQLANRYSGTLQAVELFPAANTVRGWGSQPDPRLYAALAAHVKYELQRSGSLLLFPVAGLEPVAAGSQIQDVDDIIYLRGLYAAGISVTSDIISLRLNNLTGDPLLAPDGNEHRILRHYEEIRQVMLENAHNSGLVWITQLFAPDGTINTADKTYLSQQNQASWLAQAYPQMRAQLYIGAAFYGALNPDQAGIQGGRAFVSNQTHFHTFYSQLRDLIVINSPETALARRGNPKDGEIVKIITAQ